MELRLTAQRAGRLSSILRGELAMSAGLMNRLKWGDALRVNGEPRHTDYPVQIGDEITVRLTEAPPEYPAQDAPLSILYEDDWLLAVEKPAGMLIHPSRSCYCGTLANYVAGYYRRTGQTGAFHPLTRLDRDTFGLVLIAKNAYVHARLQEGSAHKCYHALTLGGPEADAGEIDAPIARRPLPSLLREVRPDGKPSRTRYQVLQRRDGLCKLALTPVTGRTHQLRVHCAYMGYPILGDPQYATPESLARSQAMGLCTQALCAHTLSLQHPITGTPLTLTANMDVSL